MPLSVDWSSKVITVPQSYLTPQGGGVYEMNVNQFRLDLKDIEDGEQGIVFPDTHRHVTETTLGGVTYSRFVEIINGYTVTFEDGQYIINLVGANNNIADVANLNQVSIRSANSAGLQTVVQGSGVTEQDKTDIMTRVWSEQARGVKLDELKLTAALEQTLTQIKGSGWTDETLKYLKELIGGIEVSAKASFKV